MEGPVYVRVCLSPHNALCTCVSAEVLYTGRCTEKIFSLSLSSFAIWVSRRLCCKGVFFGWDLCSTGGCTEMSFSLFSSSLLSGFLGNFVVRECPLGGVISGFNLTIFISVIELNSGHSLCNIFLLQVNLCRVCYKGCSCNKLGHPEDMIMCSDCKSYSE